MLNRLHYEENPASSLVVGKNMHETGCHHKSPWGVSTGCSLFRGVKWLGCCAYQFGLRERAALSVIAVGHSSASPHQGTLHEGDK